jgi:hypothetical protein
MTYKLISLALLLVLTGQVQDYEVRLARPTKVSAKYRLTATSSETVRSRLTTGDKVLKANEEGFTLELVADTTVLEVDAQGHATRKSFSIISSKITRAGTAIPLLSPGTVVVAAAQGSEVVFLVDGKPVESGVAKALSSVLSVYSGYPDDDEVFGTRARRKTGESWGVNTDAAMAMLKELGAEAKKEDLKGSTTFEKIANGHLFISAWMSSPYVLFPLPEGFNAESGSFRFDVSGRFPDVNSDGSMDETQKSIFETTGRRAPTAASPELRFSVVFESSATYQTKVLR